MSAENLEPVHTIMDLCTRSRDISLAKGWLNPDGTDPRPTQTVYLLFLSELVEAFEDIRDNRKLSEVYYEHGRIDPHSPPRPGDKPCGFPVELADTVIRVCQYCGSNDLVAPLVESVKMNIGRDSKALVEKDLAQACIEFTKWYETNNVAFLGMAVATLFDFCTRNNIDLWAAIDEKEAYNRTRPMRHGGKSC